MSLRNVVQRTFDKFGTNLSMEKHSGSWYARNQEITTVLNLQKSEYGPKYYLNVALCLNQANDAKYPKEWECHIRARVNQLLPDLRQELQELLDLSTTVDEASRAGRLEDILQRRLRPIIESASSLQGLRQLFAEGTLKDVAIKPQATKLLRKAAAS